jgi:hypothetical protein
MTRHVDDVVVDGALLLHGVGGVGGGDDLKKSLGTHWLEIVARSDWHHGYYFLPSENCHCHSLVGASFGSWV